MTDAAQNRAEDALRFRREPQPLDIQAAETELDHLMRGQIHG